MVARLDTLRPNGANAHEKMLNLRLLFKDLIATTARDSVITQCAIEDIPPFVNVKRQSALFKLAKATAYIELAFVDAGIPITAIRKERRSKHDARKLAGETTTMKGSQHAYDALLIGHLAGFHDVTG